MSVFLWCVAGVIGLSVLIGACYTGHPVRALLGSALQGACALAAVNVLGMFSGVSLGFNLLSGVTCVAAGVPGIATLLFLKAIFAI